MGSERKFKPLNDGAGPGAYHNEESLKSTLPKSRAAMIREPTSKYKKPVEHSPDPGQYDSHLTPFGQLPNNIGMGSKYKFKPLNESAGPGAYFNERSFSATMPESRSVIIREQVMKYKKPKENLPDPGSYDKHLTPFGSEAKSFRIGELPADKTPNQGGGPGAYDFDLADSATK